MDPALQAAAEDAAQQVAGAVNWPRLLHVFGVVTYVGSLLAIARILALLPSAPPPQRPGAAALARRAHMTVSFPALAVLILAGLHSAFAKPENRDYLKEPWFLLKMTLVLLVITVDHVLIVRPLKAIARDQVDPAAQKSLYRAGFWVIGLLFFALLLTLYVFRYA